MTPPAAPKVNHHAILSEGHQEKGFSIFKQINQATPALSRIRL